MTERKPDVFEIVHEAFDKDTTHSLARKAVEAVLDLHHEYKGHCYACSSKIAVSAWPRGAVSFPCPTVQGILKVVR